MHKCVYRVIYILCYFCPFPFSIFELFPFSEIHPKWLCICSDIKKKLCSVWNSPIDDEYEREIKGGEYFPVYTITLSDDEFKGILEFCSGTSAGIKVAFYEIDSNLEAIFIGSLQLFSGTGLFVCIFFFCYGQLMIVFFFNRINQTLHIGSSRLCRL